MQTTSARGVAEIISHEAVVLSRYKDSKGIWTIGVGHTAAAGGLNSNTFTGTLTLAEAIALFQADLAKFEARVRRAFTRPLRQHEFDAAVSFDFNTGAIHRATWVKTFNAGNRALAIGQIMAWKKPKEIIARRQAEQALFANGTYKNNGTAAVYPASKAGVVQWAKGQRVNVAGLLLPPEPAAPIPMPPPGAPLPAPEPAKPQFPSAPKETPPMTETLPKGALRSKTIIGALLTLISAFGLFGMSFDADTFTLSIKLDTALEAVLLGGVPGGALLSWFGRLTANRAVKGLL